jgi:hypothetical protein
MLASALIAPAPVFSPHVDNQMASTIRADSAVEPTRSENITVT